MRRARSLVLLAAAAAIVGGIVWWDRGRPSTDDQRESRARLLPTFDRERTAALVIERGGETLRLEREAAGWWLTAPKRRADDARIEAILSVLEFGRVERRLYPDAAARARYGLDSPRATLTAGGVIVRVGADAPGGHTVYAQFAGQAEAMVVEHRLIEVLSDQLVSLAITVAPPRSARSVVARDGSLERMGDGWRLTRPIKARTDPAAVDAWLDKLTDLRALRLIPGEGAHVGQQQLLALDGKPEAWAGSRNACGADDEVARADGATLCFARAPLFALLSQLSRVRDLRLLPFPVGDVRAIDLVAGDKRLGLRREDNQWRLSAPASAVGPADDGAVREWLEQLAALKAGGVTQPLGEHHAELRLATAGDEETLLVGAAHVVQRSDENEALVLPGPLPLMIDPEAFRPRRVLRFPVGEIDSLEVRQGRVIELAARRSEGGFLLATPLLIDADQPTVARLVETLAGLTAERFEPGAELRPVRSVTAWTLPVDGGKASFGVELGATDEHGCRARVAEGPPFHLPRETCAALDGHLATRALFELAGLTRIRLERGAEQFVAERRGDAWFYPGDRQHPERIQAVSTALSALTGEVVAYGEEPAVAARALIGLTYADGGRELILALGAPSKGFVLARRPGRAILYRLRAADVDALFAATRGAE